jgi:hypothetical protein
MKEVKKNIPASLENWRYISNLKIDKNLEDLDAALTLLIECFKKKGPVVER